MKTAERTTKYSVAVQCLMHRLGHATNLELLERLRGAYPELSATTVHRITARLYERRELQLAPSTLANAMRYDANTSPHDHFMCSRCGLLRDAHFAETIRPLIEQSVGDGCSISGSLTVSGVCKTCQKAGTV